MSFQASNIDLRYQIIEDRLLVTLRSERQSVDLLMTRRLTRAVLSGMVDLLVRSSADIDRVPVSARSDVLLFEHMEAASHWTRETPPSSVAPDVTGSARQNAAPANAPALMTRLDLSLREGGLLFNFFDGAGEQAQVLLPREKAHQFLSMLVEKCQSAQWDIGEMSWLSRRGQVVIPDGASLS